jgi:hypothetical protein
MKESVTREITTPPLSQDLPPVIPTAPPSLDMPAVSPPTAPAPVVENQQIETPVVTDTSVTPEPEKTPQ